VAGLGTTRRRQGRDEIEQYPQSKTVTVVSKGNTYAVNVISDDGKLISVAALEKQFAAIESEAAAPLSINVRVEKFFCRFSTPLRVQPRGCVQPRVLECE
jgi:hypothetical protein